MMLTNDEIALIRTHSLSRRAEFMELANEVCEMLEVPFAKITGVTRGGPDVCQARDLICRLAFDRGFHPRVIARFIRRERSSVIYAIKRTMNNPVDNAKDTGPVLQMVVNHG